MAEMAIPIVVFAVILVIGLILLIIIYPRVLNVAVDAIKRFIKELGCMLCKSVWPICFGC
ncbi:MAG: hypothetical protein QXU71_01520 [Candidatus Aenigmatarchaeota archaeon]